MRLCSFISHIIKPSSNCLGKYYRLFFLINKYNGHVSFSIDLFNYMYSQCKSLETYTTYV